MFEMLYPRSKRRVPPGLLHSRPTALGNYGYPHGDKFQFQLSWIPKFTSNSLAIHGHLPFFFSPCAPTFFFGLPLSLLFSSFFFTFDIFVQAGLDSYFLNMRFAQASSFSLVATVLLVSAAPRNLMKRVAPSDILVFQFAHVLEQLESQFYTEALSKFQANAFSSAGFSSSPLVLEQLSGIKSDEDTHSSFLQSAILSFGAKPITNCTFEFSGALTDVATMAATARVLEIVGVSAYLGGAALVSDPVLLIEAATILTVEARHQTILNALSGDGTAIPNAFDFALTPSEVLALASLFFKGRCDVGIPANPILSVTNTGSIGPGTQLSFSSPAINSSTDTSGFFCQMLIGGQPLTIPFPFGKCVVPSGINGPVAIFVTSDGQPLLNNVRDRATSQLVAGPAMAFIDTQKQILGKTIGITSGSSSGSGSGSGNGNGGTITTQTISPSQASAIISGSVSTATSASDSVSASASASASDSASASASASATDSASASAVPPSSSSSA